MRPVHEYPHRRAVNMNASVFGMRCPSKHSIFSPRRCRFFGGGEIPMSDDTPQRKALIQVTRRGKLLDAMFLLILILERLSCAVFRCGVRAAERAGNVWFLVRMQFIRHSDLA